MTPKYCSLCGKRLRDAERKLDGFDPYSGRQLVVPQLICPDRGDERLHDLWENNPANASQTWERWNTD